MCNCHLAVEKTKKKILAVMLCLVLKVREWIKAMEEEMESMKTNQVWDLIDLPSRQDPLEINRFLKLNVRRMGQ
jgi:hypothetical protein